MIKKNERSNNNFIKISENKRYFIKNLKPFVWMGDTAWELFHRLNREEACKYLKIRAKQGFNVIQAVVLAENDGLKTPNVYGEVPFLDLSPDKPNEKYFEHVDFIVNKAEELDLQIAMLPTWGDKIDSIIPGAGPVVFNTKNAENFGEFLGKRYQDKPVIWILGGDRFIDNLEVLEIWRAMARGIRKGDQGNHLISFHPRGGNSSANWLHHEDWLDFNMYQSGHGKPFIEVYEYAQSNYVLSPIKPVLDAEPAYEDIPISFWEFTNWEGPIVVPEHVLDKHGLIKEKAYFEKGYFIDYDIRVLAYWNFLSGVCGFTYGNNAVWQMFKKGMPISVPCLYDWYDSLNRPGANQMIHVKKLFETYSILKLIPDQSIIFGTNYRDDMHIRAARANDNSFALVYLSQGQSVSILLKNLKGPDIVAKWYNPREGTMTIINDLKKTDIETFNPPSSGLGNDWMLVLECSSRI